MLETGGCQHCGLHDALAQIVRNSQQLLNEHHPVVTLKWGSKGMSQGNRGAVSCRYRLELHDKTCSEGLMDCNQKRCIAWCVN